MSAGLASSLPALDPVVGHAAACAVGAVLLLGAIDKLRAPALFSDALANYRLLPAAAVAPGAFAFALMELLAGALLLPADLREIGAALALLVLLAATTAVGINLQRGRDRIDCGCGGDLHTPISWALVARNALLMLLAAAAAAPGSPRHSVWLDFFAVGCSALFLTGLYFLTNAMLSHRSHLLDLRNSP